MTVAECIHQEFSMVGTISDYGVRRFAREWGYDPNSLAGSDHQQPVSYTHLTLPTILRV